MYAGGGGVKKVSQLVRGGGGSQKFHPYLGGGGVKQVFGYRTRIWPAPPYINNEHSLNTLRKTRQSDFLYIKYCKSAFAQKLPLYCFPSVWNKWITSTINVKSKSQFKQVVKTKMLASYSNSANLHCTDCDGQSVYSN